MKDTEQRLAAKEFAAYWMERGDEKGESQKYWLALLEKVLGVANPEQFIIFEDRVFLGHTSFIDGRILSTKVLIEQKKRGKNLNEPIRQSDGSLLTPFEQAKRYSANIPYSQRPRWIVTCNFQTFNVYDMEQPNGAPEVIELKNLEKEYYRLNFLVNSGNESLKREMEISLAAGDLVGLLYDSLLKQYKDPTNERSLKSLYKLCVRIVFCLYAEDAGIFGSHTMFHDYMIQYEAKEWREKLLQFFHILNQNPADRDPYINEDLAAFPYVNGGLFSDEDIEIPNITEEIRSLILSKGSEDFDWSKISPTIFGAVFESTLNPDTRRNGGMHYTSIENIHKVIDPLFLDDLREEFDAIKDITVGKTKKTKLIEFQEKLATLKFLDPACGSGNFLTETYISIRRIENEVIKILTGGQISFGEVINPIKVSIRQFYGIEINDFAVTVAKTALWIAESQMMKETEDIVKIGLDFLPLKTNACIVEGNALRMDWCYLHDEDKQPIIKAKKTYLLSENESEINGPVIVAEPGMEYEEIGLLTSELHVGQQQKNYPKIKYDYIMGNPPFVGARLMSAAQKDDVLSVFGKNWKNVGNLDYVSCWYKKAAEYMKGTEIRTELVSTNSVSQGETVANLWRPLIEMGCHIDFAYRTFRWDSEAKIKAHVHCVIIGFSIAKNEKEKTLYYADRFLHVKNINPYLVDAVNTYVESRNKPICKVPEIGIGNKPIDGGFYLFTKEEMEEFIKKEPKAEKYFKEWYGSQEFINQKPRYCLWLGDCSPAEIRSMPYCMKRVEEVRNYRLKSPSLGTVRLADKPTRFHVENMPSTNYIVIPETSSERRRYIPIGFMTPTVLCSNAVRLMPNATLYHFGVLTSNVHMSWVRAVCGRLKSDYRYSKDVVYNNFPWCNPTKEQRDRIEKTAQMILDARAKYKECSLADLYDDLIMPSELREAHQENNRAVMSAYGIPIKGTTENDCVAILMELYKDIVDKTQ